MKGIMVKKFNRQKGKKRIQVYRDEYGIQISFMRNGWQSTVVEVDDELMNMLIDAIDDFKKSEA